MTKEYLTKIINSLLSIKGYKRKGNEWCKEINDIVSILHLQKSRWSNQYYVSLNAQIKELLPGENFKQHVGIRFESILGNNVIDLFNLENDLEEKSHEQKIREVITKLLPILEKFETLQGLKEVISTYGKAVITTKNANVLLAKQ